jgi:transposase
MGKYETAFKLKVVKSFLAGDGGAKLLARRWSVAEVKIRTWVSHYRSHGIDGLRPKRGTYSAQFKLEVLSHQDREKLSNRQVAAIYDVRNSNRVISWRRAYEAGGVAALQRKRKVHPVKTHGRKPELPQTDGEGSVRALREEAERLRAEVAYLKKLQTLVRERQAVQKKRKPSSI